MPTSYGPTASKKKSIADQDRSLDTDVPGNQERTLLTGTVQSRQGDASVPRRSLVEGEGKANDARGSVHDAALSAQQEERRPQVHAIISPAESLHREEEPQQEPFTSVSPPSVNSWSTGQSAPSGANVAWTPTLDPTGQFSCSGPSNAGPNVSLSGSTPHNRKSPFLTCLRAPQTRLQFSSCRL